MTLFLLQFSLIAAAFLHAQQYRQQASELADSQRDLFERVFPGEAIPIGVVSRLQSEHRRLAGTRGMADAKVPKLNSTIPVAHVLLSSLPQPSEARFTLDRIELLPGELSLISGEAKSYGDLERIAEGLRGAGFGVPPVSSTKTASGVTLRFEEIGLVGGTN